MKLINSDIIRVTLILKAALIVLLLVTIPALTMSGGHYELTWTTLDGGGGTSTGGQYLLIGTIGQPDTGWMIGDGFELYGGFWPGELICIVDFNEFALFAEWWMNTNCGLGNDWCNGADLDKPSDGKVDYNDLLEFTNYWLFYCPGDWQLK